MSAVALYELREAARAGVAAYAEALDALDAHAWGVRGIAAARAWLLAQVLAATSVPGGADVLVLHDVLLRVAELAAESRAVASGRRVAAASSSEGSATRARADEAAALAGRAQEASNAAAAAVVAYARALAGVPR